MRRSWGVAFGSACWGLLSGTGGFGMVGCWVLYACRVGAGEDAMGEEGGLGSSGAVGEANERTGAEDRIGGGDVVVCWYAVCCCMVIDEMSCLHLDVLWCFMWRCNYFVV